MIVICIVEGKCFNKCILHNILFESVFASNPVTRNRQFHNTEDIEATWNAFAVLVFTTPISIRGGYIGFSVGVGCSILCLGVWRCLCYNWQRHRPTLSLFNNKPVKTSFNRGREKHKNKIIMKKTFFITLAFLLSTASSFANDFVVDGIAYDRLEDGISVAVVCNWYWNPDITVHRVPYKGSISIPSTVTTNKQTYKVTSIIPDFVTQNLLIL